MSRIRVFPRQIPQALFAPALLLRVLIPAGWMPTTSADGMVRISMCTGMGAHVRGGGTDSIDDGWNQDLSHIGLNYVTFGLAVRLGI